MSPTPPLATRNCHFFYILTKGGPSQGAFTVDNTDIMHGAEAAAH